MSTWLNLENIQDSKSLSVPSPALVTAPKLKIRVILLNRVQELGSWKLKQFALFSGIPLLCITFMHFIPSPYTVLFISLDVLLLETRSSSFQVLIPILNHHMALIPSAPFWSPLIRIYQSIFSYMIEISHKVNFKATRSLREVPSPVEISNSRA